MERKDYEFLLLVNKFCNKIDIYCNQLNLDEKEVEELKNDIVLFSFLFANNEDFTSYMDSFSIYKIRNMRISLSHLAQRCKNSKNYSISIGMDLGIEMPVYAFQPN